MPRHTEHTRQRLHPPFRADHHPRECASSLTMRFFAAGQAGKFLAILLPLVLLGRSPSMADDENNFSLSCRSLMAGGDTTTLAPGTTTLLTPITCEQPSVSMLYRLVLDYAVRVCFFSLSFNFFRRLWWLPQKHPFLFNSVASRTSTQTHTQSTPESPSTRWGNRGKSTRCSRCDYFAARPNSLRLCSMCMRGTKIIQI